MTLPRREGKALKKCMGYIFSDWASWHVGIKKVKSSKSKAKDF
jgi:hypothetical protein